MNPDARPRAPWLFFAGGVLGLALLAALVAKHWGYYVAGEHGRLVHAQYSELRSSGRVGLACGLAGTLLILLNLTYLARKRLLGWTWLGPLRSWMAFHVFTGVLGAGLIALHCGFTPRSSLGTLGVAGLGIAVATGLVGRYIYARVPRSREGSELERAELEARLATHRARLDHAGIRLGLAAPERTSDLHAGLWRRMRGVVVGDAGARAHYRQLRAEIRRRPALRSLAGELLPIARRYTRERQWLARYQDLRSLMGSWRFLHRWLALVMLVVIVFHVYVAVRFGDLDWKGLVP